MLPEVDSFWRGGGAGGVAANRRGDYAEWATHAAEIQQRRSAWWEGSGLQRAYKVQAGKGKEKIDE